MSLLHLGRRATVGAVVVGGCLTLRAVRRQPLLKVAFNAGTLVLCIQLAAIVLDVGHIAAIDSLRSIAFGFGACVLFSLSGSILVLIVVRVSGETITASDLVPSLGVSALASLAAAAVAMATAALASSTPIAKRWGPPDPSDVPATTEPVNRPAHHRWTPHRRNQAHDPCGHGEWSPETG